MAEEGICFGCGESTSSKLKKCGSCQWVTYHDINCQKRDWPRHKSLCKWIVNATGNPNDGVPLVLVVGVEEGVDLFQNVQQHLVQQLKRRAKVVYAEKVTQVIAMFELHQRRHTNISAALLVDSSPTKGETGEVLRPLLESYVKLEGGTVIMCGGFVDFTNRPDFHRFMRTTFNLEWSFGAYQRTTFALNTSAKLRGYGIASYTNLRPEYSMKANHVVGVNTRENVLYSPAQGAVVQSMVFAPTKVNAAVDGVGAAFQTVGNGFVGFVGDVNGEEGTTWVVLAMANLTRN